MIGFDRVMVLIRTADCHNVVISEPFSYTTAKGEVITIGIGDQSDGASTPRLIWSIVPPFGPYWKAYVLHDHLYRYTQKTKDECDALLHEAMMSLGASKEFADTVWKGVQDGGQSSFDEDRKNQGGITK